jgi:hypothetical protein
MRIILSCLVALLLVTSVDAGGRRSRQRAAQNNVVWNSQPVVSSAPASVEATSHLKGSDDALAEVNEARAKLGLRAFVRDPLLTKAALLCAQQRAARNIHGHLPESDFTYLHQVGGQASAAGCGALDPSWGWQSCCWQENWTRAGAAWVMGPDNRRFMHIFCGN